MYLYSPVLCSNIPNSKKIACQWAINAQPIYIRKMTLWIFDDNSKSIIYWHILKMHLSGAVQSLSHVQLLVTP